MGFFMVITSGSRQGSPKPVVVERDWRMVTALGLLGITHSPRVYWRSCAHGWSSSGESGLVVIWVRVPPSTGIRKKNCCSSRVGLAGAEVPGFLVLAELGLLHFTKLPVRAFPPVVTSTRWE
jgi:hypothetical protein